MACGRLLAPAMACPAFHSPARSYQAHGFDEAGNFVDRLGYGPGVLSIGGNLVANGWQQTAPPQTA